MRVVHANFVRPRGHSDPLQLLEQWPTLIDVASAVAAAGVEVVLVQSFSRDATVETRGVTCRFVREPRLPGLAAGLAPWRPARAASQARPQVIHVNGLDFPRHTRAMCATGIPVLVQDHASHAGKGRQLRRWGLAGAAAVAFTDSAQAKPFIADGSIAGDMRVFSVPESSTRFAPGDQAEARAATGVHGDPAALWVGRLDANKDPLTILDAIDLAAGDLRDIQLWCCFHEQQLLAEVERRIAASPRLAQRVHLLGQVPHAQVELLCRAADFFVLGSRSEGSGYALIEALACGCTPVVSDIPSFRRLVGNAGALAPTRDAEAFAQQLIRLARSHRTELRAAALRHFETELSFGAIGRQLREIYETLAAEGP